MVTETGTREEFPPSQARGVIKNRPQEQGVREAKALVHSVVGSCVPPLAQGAQVREPALQEARGMQRPALWRTKNREKKAFASHLPWVGAGGKRQSQRSRAGFRKAVALRNFSRADGESERLSVGDCFWSLPHRASRRHREGLGSQAEG